MRQNPARDIFVQIRLSPSPQPPASSLQRCPVKHRGKLSRHILSHPSTPEVFVAFIRYAKGRVYFKDWHIFLCEHFLGLGLGQGLSPKHFFCMNSSSSASWLSFDMLKGMCTLRIGIYFYVNIFWGWRPPASGPATLFLIPWPQASSQQTGAGASKGYSGPDVVTE